MTAKLIAALMAGAMMIGPAQSQDDELKVQLKTQPAEITVHYGEVAVPFSVTNTSSSPADVTVECAALDNDTLIDTAIASSHQLHQNETAYGYAYFIKAKDVHLTFKCRVLVFHQ